MWDHIFCVEAHRSDDRGDRHSPRCRITSAEAAQLSTSLDRNTSPLCAGRTGCGDPAGEDSFAKTPQSFRFSVTGPFRRRQRRSNFGRYFPAAQNTSPRDSTHSGLARRVALMVSRHGPLAGAARRSCRRDRPARPFWANTSGRAPRNPVPFGRSLVVVDLFAAIGVGRPDDPARFNCIGARHPSHGMRLLAGRMDCRRIIFAGSELRDAARHTGSRPRRTASPLTASRGHSHRVGRTRA